MFISARLAGAVGFEPTITRLTAERIATLLRPNNETIKLLINYKLLATGMPH